MTMQTFVRNNAPTVVITAGELQRGNVVVLNSGPKHRVKNVSAPNKDQRKVQFDGFEISVTLPAGAPVTIVDPERVAV